MGYKAYHRNAHGIWALQGSEECFVKGCHAYNDCKPDRNPDDHFYSILNIFHLYTIAAVIIQYVIKTVLGIP